MIRWQPSLRPAHDLLGSATLQRLRLLAPGAVTRIDRHLQETRAAPRQYRARRDILPAGMPLDRPCLVVDGWVCQHRLLQDGRRQLIALALPGELLLPAMRPTSDAIGAVSDATLIELPVPDGEQDALNPFYAAAGRLQHGYLLDQIVRLGRQVAYERMSHLLLELHGRLELSGLTDGDSFRLPLTQELLADLLGLTSVHVNRTLQMLKQDGLISSNRGMVTLHDRAALARLADFHPARTVAGAVTSGQLAQPANPIILQAQMF